MPLKNHVETSRVSITHHSPRHIESLRVTYTQFLPLTDSKLVGTKRPLKKNRFLNAFTSLTKYDDRVLCYSVPEFHNLTTNVVSNVTSIIDQIKEIVDFKEDKVVDLSTPPIKVTFPCIQLLSTKSKSPVVIDSVKSADSSPPCKDVEEAGGL